MHLFTFRGIVLRTAPVGEKDKMLTVLSDELGKITILAKGARKVGSKFSSASMCFVYSHFTVGKLRDMYYLRECDIQSTFYSVTDNSLESFTVMSYIAQVCEDVSTSEPQGELLSLALNSLYLLKEKKKSEKFIKAVFEMRCASICGFAPDISSCRVCSELKDEMFLEIMDGTLICSECKKITPASQELYEDSRTLSVIVRITPTAASAIRYVLYAPPKKIFSFNIIGEDAALFYSACEKYLINHLERTFPALEYYSTITNI